MGREIEAKVEFNWNMDGSTWVDESANLISCSGSSSVSPRGKSSIGTQGVTAQASITLWNNDYRYTPSNSSSPIYAYLSGGELYQVPCRISVDIDSAGYERIFWGIVSLSEAEYGGSSDINTVRFKVRTREDEAMQAMVSSEYTDMVNLYTNGATESDIIEEWLGLLGYTSSDWDLDPGLVTIPWAWLDEEPLIEDIWDLASVCLGRFYADQNGKFVYRNAASVATAARSNTSQLTVNDDSAFSDISVQYDQIELYSDILVTVSERNPSIPKICWEPESIPVVPAGETITVEASLSEPLYEIHAIAWNATSYSGQNITSDVTVTLVSGQSYSQKVVFEIANGNATYAAAIRGFQIQGRTLEGSDSKEIKVESAESFWNSRTRRTRRFPSSPYIQTPAHGYLLANYALNWHELPRPFVKVMNLEGEPGLRIDDLISVSVTDVIAASVILTSVNWRLSKGEFNQTIVGFDATNIYPNSSDSYFIIGSSLMGSLSVANGNGKLFY